MFSLEQFHRLAFLEGRWIGTAPDGAEFHEEYAFTAPGALACTRHATAAFAEPVDTSTVTLLEGEVLSQWNVFRWRAVALDDGHARFEPVDAPSAFSWTRLADGRIEVVQRWTDEGGASQSMTMHLRRA
ncbi:hypothetical protein QFW80_10820 [Luteimonas sp. M1R5S18]|jgi:hypothetical protein|uniref:Uncharacterized protein n=1 Tax=Luteimonas rhizosphaericola TaxID=3042024 RepID=A0ABT6JK05_9GAMM|nr:hypothetical protein [Luteimonas rhizosphaericola]MDH5831007.1 hypothetical protein [Luteimonas rhizosphaericola]